MHQVSSQPTPKEVLSRIAMPLFLFSVTLLCLLLVSWVVVLPRLTTVEVGGVMRDARELKEYAEGLRSRISELQEKRNAQVIPLQGTLFRVLADDKGGVLSPTRRYQEIQEIIRRHGGQSVVSLTTYTFDPDSREIWLQGDVRNVGTSSMTVLAAFIEDLRSLLWVADTGSVRFERLDDPEIGPHSPFRLHLTLSGT